MYKQNGYTYREKREIWITNKTPEWSVNTNSSRITNIYLFHYIWFSSICFSCREVSTSMQREISSWWCWSTYAILTDSFISLIFLVEKREKRVIEDFNHVERIQLLPSFSLHHICAFLYIFLKKEVNFRKKQFSFVYTNSKWRVSWDRLIQNWHNEESVSENNAWQGQGRRSSSSSCSS